MPLRSSPSRHNVSRFPAWVGPSALLCLVGLLGCGRELSAGDTSAPEGEALTYSASHNASDESPRGSDGRIDGMVTEWYEDTGMRAGEGEYRNNRRVGPWVFWYPDGELRLQCAFRDGIQSGDERVYYPSGTLHYTGKMAGGQRNGEYESWRPDGSPAWKGSFVDGRKHGEFTYWRPDGSVDESASGKYQNDIRR